MGGGVGDALTSTAGAADRGDSTATISLSSIADWESEAQASPKTQLARTVFSQTNITTLLKREVKIADYHVFNTELPYATSPITNQKSSGRCWLFATTNVLRYDIAKKLNLSDFQCSQVRTLPLLWRRYTKDDA